MASDNSPNHPRGTMDLTKTYPTHALLLADARSFASNAGFLVRDHPRGYFQEKEWPFALSFSSTPKRGAIVCSPKSKCRCPGSICPWKLSYLWIGEKKAYCWRPESCNLHHTHDIPPPPMTFEFDGRTEVVCEQDLSSEEERFIKDQSLSRIGIPQMQVNLEREFSFRSFDYELLRRVRDKVLDERFGSDRTQLHALVKKGDAVRRHGGIFAIDPSPEDFGIDAIHFQPRLFRAYATIYGTNDFKMADGTHHLSQHKSIAVFWTVIDCLMRTKFAGCTFAFTENSLPIIRGAQMFFPGEHVGSNSSTTFDVCELPGYFDPLVDDSVNVSVLDSNNDVDDPKVGTSDDPDVDDPEVGTSDDPTTAAYDPTTAVTEPPEDLPTEGGTLPADDEKSHVSETSSDLIENCVVDRDDGQDLVQENQPMLTKPWKLT